MAQSDANQTRWYPTSSQLKDPSSLEKAFRQLLQQHYALQDAHEALKTQVSQPADAPKGPPPGSGPADSMLLGLRVAPVDASTLTDGASLKFSKKNGNFQFS